MRLRELDGVAEILAGSQLAQDSLWEKELASVTEMDITLFYARAGIQMRGQATDLIERIQSRAIVAAYRGCKEAGLSALIAHTPPVNPFLVDELVTGLSRLSMARRCAVLFALTTGSSPEFVTTLTWDALPQMGELFGVAKEIIEECAKTRHIRLPYVFWEWATPRIAAPIMNLQASAEEAFGCSWPQLVERHARMVKLNRSADSASFLQLADEVRRGRL